MTKDDKRTLFAIFLSDTMSIRAAFSEEIKDGTIINLKEYRSPDRVEGEVLDVYIPIMLIKYSTIAQYTYFFNALSAHV